MANKKKTGQAKKRQKQAERQKVLRSGAGRDISSYPCNASMECDTCHRQQRNRAFCYFCQAVQRLPQCAQCGRTKCAGAGGMGGGDCLVKHPTRSATGLAFVGATCDFCDAWICHSRRCIQSHACSCVLAAAECAECARSVFSCGGRFFQCATCTKWLCEDDQFEHQAMCVAIDSDNYKCRSCNRFGIYACLICKLAFCQDHVKRKGSAPVRGKDVPCPKCAAPVHETKGVSVSTRRMAYGRHNTATASEAWYSRGSAAGGAAADDVDDAGGDGDGAGFYGFGSSDRGAASLRPEAFSFGGVRLAGASRRAHGSGSDSGGDAYGCCYESESGEGDSEGDEEGDDDDDELDGDTE